MIILDPTTHTYLDSNDVKYKSVTTLIKDFVPKFDFDEKSKLYAAKYGLDVEEVRQSWRQKNVDSTSFGTAIHKEIENLINEGVYNGEPKFKEPVSEVVNTIVSDFKPGNFLLEHIVFNEEYKIAGTADVIVDNKKSFSVLDFKTNKEFKVQNPYDKYLLEPISHLPNGEFFKYSLQLSFYAYFYSLATSKSLDRLAVYWLDRTKNNNSYTNLNKSKWVRYNLPYLKEEVIDCLNHYGKEN